MSVVTDATPIEGFISWAKGIALQTAVATIKIKFPVVAAWWNWIGWLIEMVIKELLEDGEFMGFKVNSQYLTSAQAADARAAYAKLMGLPDNVSDQEWEETENEASHAILNLIRFNR